MLLATGLSEAAAGGAVARLDEVERLGQITGEAWDGAKSARPAFIRGKR